MNNWKFIQAVGCELEAGFKNKRTDLHQDDSLRSDQFYNSACWGELISDPLNDEESVIKWIKWGYEELSESPLCAAYHIHVSFKHINYYSQCMTKEFYEEFLKSIEQWAQDFPIRNDAFWDRLKGNNKYCVNEFRAEKQVKCCNKDEMRKSDLRRTVLNYCFGLHRTIENRLFPTFKNVDTAISATLAYLNFIEGFLEKNPISEGEILMEVVDDGEFYESNGLITTINNKINLKPFNLYTRGKQTKRLINYGKDTSILEKSLKSKKLVPINPTNISQSLDEILSESPKYITAKHSYISDSPDE